ncbi:phosphatidate cytidylyltransferase [Rhodohalobacter mucosus]|uniref:phosphatidate cytidylyltransferase n=1 Tax=Rhodohalobacter mucosus TaxID=2079485 RepID=UPI001304B8CB|nr:phosphatidate cytidylyltransferase [Rhodohalobacter mucosus]
MSELTKRILFAVPAAAFFLWITWLGGNAFQTLIFAIALLTVWEVHRLTQRTPYSDLFPISLIITLMIWRGELLPPWILYPAAGMVIAATLWAWISKKDEWARRWFSTLLTGVYAPFGFYMLIELRQLGTNTEGFWLTLSLLLMIWGNDMLAYFGGRKFGKNKLAPVSSPNKTWEGFAFGFLGAALGFTITWFISDTFPVAAVAAIPAIIIVSTMGPLGDVTASRLKRIADVKDSSSLLPGHGGLFDRFDSLILSAPFVYFLYRMFMH